MLCDFYGKVLVPPTVVEHQRAALEMAVLQLRETREKHDLRDHIVAVEMTGTYHRPVQRAFRRAGSETRLVHPFASRHYRLPAHGDIKTDDHDLEGIFVRPSTIWAVGARVERDLCASANCSRDIDGSGPETRQVAVARSVSISNGACLVTRICFRATICGRTPRP